MKKLITELTAKTSQELDKEVADLRLEIAKLIVESKAKPQKDTNTIKKKQKRIAYILTVKRQKELGITK